MTRGRKLTHEERVLWRSVALTARPLPERSSDSILDPIEEVVRDDRPAAGNRKARHSIHRAESASPPSAPWRKAVALHRIEKPVKRKIARGRLALEARLDLHGLFQAEAHDLLHTFLVGAHERGFRHVLVVTGKGSSLGSEGALKRAVPQWLAKPGFRHLVSGYETAARGHGGEGALYIRLRHRRSDDTM